jgi:hypothetical protein
MEWAADGKFEDHASLVFLNRKLPVPQFTSSRARGKTTIKTDALTLWYTPNASAKGRFDEKSLQLSFNPEQPASRLASRYTRHRQPTGNYPHSRRRARRQNQRADGSWSHLA